MEDTEHKDKENIVFLTGDEAFRKPEGVLDPTDQAIMDSIITGKGLITITSREQLMDFARMAGEVKDSFDKLFENMTKEQAIFVRELRVDEGYSWRAVASACNKEWGGDWGSNQLAGMAICEKAATFFDEGYEKIWN